MGDFCCDSCRVLRGDVAIVGDDDDVEKNLTCPVHDELAL